MSEKTKPSLMSEFTPQVLEMIEKTLNDHGFQMIEQIGSGGYSIIFKVYSAKYNRSFAAKIVNSRSSRHKNSEASIENEISALSHLYHPNIIKMYLSFDQDGFHFMIIELCTLSLFKLIGEKEKTSISPAKISSIICELISAVKFCHDNGFAHRDIKPINVLFDDYGRVKLADYGLSRRFEPNEKSTEYLGSPRYISPEIYRKEPFDPFKADIWALGVTIYEICGGVPDWPESKDLLAASIRSGGLLVKPTSYPKIDRLVQLMTEMNPNVRPTIEMVAKYPILTIPVLPKDTQNSLPTNIYMANSNPKSFSHSQSPTRLVRHHSRELLIPKASSFYVTNNNQPKISSLPSSSNSTKIVKSLRKQSSVILRRRFLSNDEDKLQNF